MATIHLDGRTSLAIRYVDLLHMAAPEFVSAKSPLRLENLMKTAVVSAELDGVIATKLFEVQRYKLAPVATFEILQESSPNHRRVHGANFLGGTNGGANLRRHTLKPARF
jgi:hypothetical protein